MSYDSDVINATSGRGEANWDQIIKLCNRIRDSVGPTSMSQAMGSVLRRVKHSDPNVQLHALTLLEACVSNCGKTFQSELTKPAFQGEFKSIITGSYADPRVTQRCKELLVSWSNEFKGNSSMSGLVRFVEQLRKDGISFQGLQQGSTAPTSQSPAASAASKEDDDLKRAIQMSLRDANSAPPTSTTPSLYPSMPSRTSPVPTKKLVKKVRAIYDFEAAEDNELSFRAGEIVTVLDDSDENWWRGETQLGTGLFPASFVSTNLSVDPEPSLQETKSRKKSGKSKSKKGSKGKGVDVNTDKIGLLLDMIKGADVTSEENMAENETLLELEEECKKMRPVVEQNIAALQKQEDKMQAINMKFEEALALYRKMLAEGPRLGSSKQQKQPLPNQSQPTSLPTSQQFIPSQYSLPPQQAPLQQQQSPSSQQRLRSTSPNPPPYFPLSSNPTSLPTSNSMGSQQQQALPPLQPHSIQLHSLAYGGPTTDTTSMLPAQESLRSQGHLPLPPTGQSASFYTPQPTQVVEGSSSFPSITAPPNMTVPAPLPSLPPSYNPHASLYQPVHQPLL